MAESKDKNFFSKIYNSLETNYKKACDWLTSKGIPINKMNSFLEKKGVPAFALVGSILFILIIAIIFLIFVGLAPKTIATFNIQDYTGTKLNNVELQIYDSANKIVFEGSISNKDVVKLPLKFGMYKLTATKEGYNDYSKAIEISDDNPTINIKFEEVYEMGYLSIRAIDSDNKKLISQPIGKIDYYLNNELVNVEEEPNEDGELNFYVPITKNLEVTISADGYQDKYFEYSLSSDQETRDEFLSIDAISFEGKTSKVNVIVNDISGNTIDDASVQIYNESGALLDLGTTVLGKVLFNIETGKQIKIIVTKDNYKTFDSDVDSNDSYRIVKSEENFIITLSPGGSSLRVNTLSYQNLPLENVSVSIYNNENTIVDNNLTQIDGSITFKGLDSELEYTVTACLDNYFCIYKKVSLDINNQIDIILEKITSENSELVSIFVVDAFSEIIENAKVNVFRTITDGETTTQIPLGNGELITDVSGYVSVPLKVSEEYSFTAYYNEAQDTQTLTVNPLIDNKVILVIDDASRLLQLTLLDDDGIELRSGHVLVKSKLGDVLLDANLDGTTKMFNTQGFQDLIVDYTDTNGNVTTLSATVGQEEFIELTINKELVASADAPIIEFVGVENSDGLRTNFVSVNQEYYLIFDVIFPKGATKGGVHIRSGKDTETDSENMYYGIYGFKADTTNFKYSTTYSPTPAPGAQSIDFMNSGSSSEQNKWLQLEWNNNTQLSNKQIKVKIKAIDAIQNKLLFNYRAWVNSDSNYYRNPQDTILGNGSSNSAKQNLYADTHEVYVDLFETPANCNDDFCVSYRFLDTDNFDYSTEEFFAVKDNLYAIEATLFSHKNRDVTIKSSTSTTQPIMSFISTQTQSQFPSNINFEGISELETSLENITLDAGKQKKVYVFFIAKQLGSTYVDALITGSTISALENRFNFNVHPQKEMDVTLTPQAILPYGEKLFVDLKDIEDNTPIENAFIKIKNNHHEFITSIKGNRLNGVDGRYVVNQTFSSNKIILTISAYGYKTVTKEVLVADTSILSGPTKLNINIGEKQTTDFVDFTINNTTNQQVTNLRYDVTFIDSVDSLNLALEHSSGIRKNGSGKFKLIATVDSETNFQSAKAIVSIYGFIGNKQVAKKINVNVLRGSVQSDCLLIKPDTVNSYVGKEKDSENIITFNIKNNCLKPLTVIPELKPIKATKDKLEIDLPHLVVNSEEEIEYEITVRNTEDRKLLKNYSYEISWNNPYYVFENTPLNIEIIDLAKSLSVYYNGMKLNGNPIVVPMSEPVASEPAATSTIFFIKNESNVAFRDIQISQATEKKSAQISPKIYPVKKDILLPGEEVQIVITYEVKVKDSSYDDLQFKISAYAPGVKNKIETLVNNVFFISSPQCLKVLPKKVSYEFLVGESKEKQITFTNNCAEPLTIIGIDKRNNLFNDTFGNSNVEFYAVNGGANQTIAVGQTAKFNLKIGSSELFFPRYGKVIRFLARGMSGLDIGSETLLLQKLEVKTEDKDDLVDLDQLNEFIDMPVCNSETTKNINFPLITENCIEEGYCDAYAATELILKNINDLAQQVIATSSQINDKVQESQCPPDATSKYYCSVSDIGMGVEPIEFTVYLQNDNLSKDLLISQLKEDRTKNNTYKNINNYNVREYTIKSPDGVGFNSNEIFLPNTIAGCGRYKFRIDGYVAIDHTQIYPKNAHYFVELIDYNITNACTKNIENFLVYLPLNRELKRLKPYDTWLTMLGGDRNITTSVSEKVFKDISRAQTTKSSISRSNVLDVSIGEISEDKEALAKIEFANKLTNLNKIKMPEQVNILINSSYVVDKKLPKEITAKAAKVIGNILNKQEFSEVCVSENRDYLLVKSLLEVDDLLFAIRDRNPNVQLNTNKVCKDLVIKSPVLEGLVIESEPIDGLDINYIYNDKEVTSKLPLVLEPNKETIFEVCLSPKDEFINNLVGKEVKINATSKYTQKGNMGTRNKSITLNLNSCGITPVELLDKINIKTKEIFDKDVNKSIELFALVDWDKKYNIRDTEEVCDTLSKYRKENNQVLDVFFANSANCGADQSSASAKAKQERYVKNSAWYGGTCIGVCAGCFLGVNLITTLLTGGLSLPVAAATTIKEAAFDCGLGCGLPAIGYYFRNVPLEENGQIGKMLSNIIEDAGLGKIADVAGTALNKVAEYAGYLLAAGKSTSNMVTASMVNGKVQSTLTTIPGGKGELSFTDLTLEEDGVRIVADNGFTGTSRDAYLDKLYQSKLDAADELAEINAKIAKLERRTSNFTFNKGNANKVLEELKTRQANLQDFISKVDDVDNVFSGAGSIGSETIGDVTDDVFRYSDDLGKQMDDLVEAGVKLKTTSRGTRLLNGGIGFVKGLGCTIAGNAAGVSMLKNKGLSGTLDNSLNFTNSVVFKKNTLYKVIIEPKEDKENPEKKSFYLTIDSKDITTVPNDLRIDKCFVKVEDEEVSSSQQTETDNKE